MPLGFGIPPAPHSLVKNPDNRGTFENGGCRSQRIAAFRVWATSPRQTACHESRHALALPHGGKCCFLHEKKRSERHMTTLFSGKPATGTVRCSRLAVADFAGLRERMRPTSRVCSPFP